MAKHAAANYFVRKINLVAALTLLMRGIHGLYLSNLQHVQAIVLNGAVAADRNIFEWQLRLPPFWTRRDDSSLEGNDVVGTCHEDRSYCER